MTNDYKVDPHVPVTRLQLDSVSGVLAEAPHRELFLRGPVPMDWLDRAAGLPGKALNVAIALWWLYGMKKGGAIKLTRQALKYLHVKRDAASDGLGRLERAGLIRVERRPGQRPTIEICPMLPGTKQNEKQV